MIGGGRAARAGLLLVACGLIGHALWIPIKAEVAQRLLHHAWQRAVGGEQTPEPWPWADTWPVARLRAPHHGVDHIVLEGASGAVLAFGPGRLAGARHPRGAVAIAGHRDTHFAFLRDVTAGDRLELTTADGNRRAFRVAWSRVVDQTDIDVLDAPDDALTLVTCWPFDSLTAGGRWRFVVRAWEIVPEARPGQESLDLAFVVDEPLSLFEPPELSLVLDVDSPPPPASDEPPDSPSLLFEPPPLSLPLPA